MLLLVCLIFSSFAFQNLTITPNPATIGVDTLTLTGSFEHPGDTLTVVRYFMDVNNNGVFDPGVDINMLGSDGNPQIIDGYKGQTNGPSDTVVDGLLSIKIPTGGDNGFGTPGKFCFIFASGGISSTAGFTLVQLKTKTFVLGKVVDPSGKGIAGLYIEGQFSDTANNVSQMSVMTDSGGAYAIYLDSTVRNRRVRLNVDDHGNLLALKPWIAPGEIDTFLTDSLKNMNFAYATASHFVKGTAKDDHGNPLKSAPMYLRNDSLNVTYNFMTDTLGRFLAGIPPATYSIFLQSWNYPGYLTGNDRGRSTVIVTSGTDTVTFSFVARSTDTVIGGTVHDDSLVLNNNTSLDLNASGNIQDTSFGTDFNINSNGSKSYAYKIRVSSAIDTYMIQTNANNFPAKYYVYPAQFRVHYGATSCNVAILKGAAALQGSVVDTLNNPRQYAQVMLADTVQKLYFFLQTDQNGYFKQIVPAGSFMIAFSDYDQKLNQNLSGIAGPIVITASSKDTLVTCVVRLSTQTLQRRGFAAAPLSFRFSVKPMSTVPEFSFATPVPGRACCVLFDVQGRLVGTVVDRQVSAGEYQVNWGAQGRLLAAGQTFIARFYFIGAKSYSKVTRFILVR
jgi:hypothetical protein